MFAKNTFYFVAVKVKHIFIWLMIETVKFLLVVVNDGHIVGGNLF